MLILEVILDLKFLDILASISAAVVITIRETKLNVLIHEDNAGALV